MRRPDLYPDQADLLDRVRDATRRHKGVLMQSPTGSGKTIMALDMIVGAQSKRTSTIFCVPRRELLEQTSETLRAYGVPHGVISPNHPPSPFEAIQIAMAPTLARRLDKIAAPKLLFVDECHFGGAELDRVIDWSRASGGWRIGLSATPLKTNGKGMGLWFDDMVQGQNMSSLIEAGRLSGYRYFAPNSPDLSGIKSSNGDYVRSQLSEYMEGQTQIIGDAVKHYRDHASGKLCAVFATSLKHADIIVDGFRQAGIAAQRIDGKMDGAERSRIIKGFARREFTVIVSVQLLTFGFDLASAAGMDVTIEAMSDLCPRKSLPMQLQVWGRVLRRKPEPALIFDHANNWRESGFPDDDRVWTLDGKDKRGGGGTPAGAAARQCSQCYFVHRPAPCCPDCGFVYPVMSRRVEEVDGDLVEIDPRLAARKSRQDQGRARTLDDLLEHARATGKKPAWAHHVWDARHRRA